MVRGMAVQWCLVATKAVCVTPTDGFPFWELLSTAAITGLVTWVTIWASIRGARRETERTIAASVEAERRAREERQREATRLGAIESRRQRVGLAEVLSRAVHRMQAVRELSADDRARIEAAAEWGALRVSFATATSPSAIDLYEFADLRIDEGMAANKPPRMNVVDEIFEYAVKTMYADKVSETASQWAELGVLDDKAAAALTKMRAAREERSKATNQELIKLVERLQGGPIRQQEPDVFADDDPEKNQR